jgi:hypothetical protein
MNTIVENILNFFQKNGSIKILISFVLLVISVIVLRSHPHSKFFIVIGWIGLGYLCLSFILFFGAAIINSIKDVFKKRKGE